MSKLERFLLENDENDQVFESSYKSIKLHKEKFDDRFIIIYIKDDNGGFEQSYYNVGGYFDKIDKTMYEVDYELSKIISEDVFFKIGTFDDLTKRFRTEIEDYIEKYSFDNSEKLKKIAKIKYEEKEDWKLNSYKQDVRRLFIKEDNPKINIDKMYKENIMLYSKDYKNKNFILDYLNDSKGTIKKYASLIIEDNKEALGLALYLYDDKKNYLNLIQNNKNNVFKDLYVNKKIYESIKDVNARKLNITIRYNNKDLEFKFDYDWLKRGLINDERETSYYGVSYNRVEEFLRENKKQANNYIKDFEFSHIKCITYGKNELYRNDNIIEPKKIIDRGR